MRHARFALLCLVIMPMGVPAQTQPVKPAVNTNPEFQGKTLDQWIKEIEDIDPSIREHAIKMVALMGPSAKKAAPAVIRNINMNVDLSPQTNAIIAIGLILPDDPAHREKAILTLISSLSSTQGIVRYQAANSLGNFGIASRNAIGRLTEVIRDPASWEIRKASAFALGRCGYAENNFPDIRALIALNKGIDDVSKEVRIEALQGLINLGPPELPKDRFALKEHFDKRLKVDKDKYVSIWIRVALMRLDEAAITPANLNFIAGYLKKNEPVGIAADAARALGAIGPPAKSTVPELIAALGDKDITLVAWAAWALGRMGPDARSALPALEELKKTVTDPLVKTAIEEAIKSINTPKK